MSELETNPSQETSSTEVDVDALIAQAENNGQMVPAEQPKVQEYEFKANGKSIKAPIDKILQYAAQGHGAPTKIGELNKQIQEAQARQKQYEEKYGPIDEYVRQNPQFWDHVTSTWQTVQSKNTPTTGEANPLIDRLQKTESFIQTLQQREQEQLRQSQDRQLEQQVQSIRESFKDLDWASTNDLGRNLEMQVLTYASEKNLDFETAFKAMQFDSLIKRAEERGKEQIAKTRVQNNKLGLLGKTQAPKQEGFSRLQSGSKRSDQDILNEALREAGIL